MIRETVHLLIREFFDQKIGCIGLITAQNPQEMQQDMDENRSVNDMLLDDLKSMGFEPFPTHYYGEDGFIVPGITKIQLIELGRKYNQKSVVWAKKVPEDKNGMTFNWELLEDGKIRDEKISHHPYVCPDFS